MAVSLCNGVAYVVGKGEQIERGKAFSFFLNGHLEDVLLLYDEDDGYYGMITYKSLLESHNMEEAVICEKLILDEEDADEFWRKAQNHLQDADSGVLPVFGRDMELLYFARYNSELRGAWGRLQYLQQNIDKKFWKQFKEYGRQVHIAGVNDVLYFFRKWLCSIGVRVSVEGEIWKLMGVEESPAEGGEILVTDETCGLVHSLYLEYMEILEGTMADELAELKDLLWEPYICRQEQGKIIFHLTEYSYFADSILPLVIYYLERGKECIAVFSPLHSIIWMGRENAQKLIKIIRRIQGLGGKCYLYEEKELWMQEYEICYLCSEYSNNFPSVKAKNVVAVQITAIYTHMYWIEGRFESVFSEQAREAVDYLVVSEFAADWICKRNPKWEDKMLRFGYPKLDTLYHSLWRENEIPAEWKEKAAGKKVILITLNEISSTWWEFLEDRAGIAVIWRPHPLMEREDSIKGNMDKAERMDNVIIDRRLSYYASFQLSDALITSVYSSIAVNYLYLDKPVCILDSDYDFAKAAIDYRQETWYKSADIVFEEQRARAKRKSC